MSWLFSQALVEEYSAVTCWDGVPSAPLSVMPTQHKFWRSDKTMDACDLSQFGLTCAVLTDGHGEELLTSYLEDSRARMSAPPVLDKDSMASVPAFGAKWRELSVRYDPGTSSWRTHRSLWDEDLSACSLTLPRWGSMRDGVLSEQTTLELHTSASASGLWPTPVASDTGDRKRPYAQGGTPLSLAVKYMTPTAQIGTKCGGRHNRKADTLASQIAELEGLQQTSTGRLNPPWVEWLMGWTIGWTDLKPLEMDRFREWQQQHSLYCVEDREAA